MTHDSFREYQCRVNLNLYDSPSCTRLATQAVTGRHLRILSPKTEILSIQVCLSEDDYSGWVAIQDLKEIEEAQTAYEAYTISPTEIQNRIPQVIAFMQAAMQQPNYYLWGGTVGPNYDCSGLMQAAFAASGIWLPRDSYQQEAFTESIAIQELQSGDLIFFGIGDRTTHVALYLGEGRYIHSSGQEQGRNGIGIDVLSEQGDSISQAYFRQLRSCGRVVASYQPQRQ
ncbi:C40 family peptidase [Coleofasciculus sp. FACHB-1120]|uniref:C40 family peptidase n=1 Tax=Coleofasciculus sp. FACHB-1120 TaxID=2692783 RepID=UPI0016892F4E|nr:C40 family peptidase [Coleofasciculus sp. FACHB-1120]MBD2743471.1 C40 family peptidase [Coleofasciculus sp. FACHB-1120]